MGEDTERASGLVEGRGGTEAEAKGPPSWPGPPYPTSEQLGTLEQQGSWTCWGSPGGTWLWPPAAQEALTS